MLCSCITTTLGTVGLTIVTCRVLHLTKGKSIKFVNVDCLGRIAKVFVGFKTKISSKFIILLTFW